MRWVFAAAAVIGAVMGYMILFVNPIVVASSGARIESMTVKAVHRAIADVTNMGTYRELTRVSYDSGGKITSIGANTMQINGLVSDITLIAQGHIDKFATMGVAVPLGTFSGMPVMTGKGPNVNLRLVPVGAVKCVFDSQFSHAGFNQTRHRIVLKIRTVLNLIMPLGSRHVVADVEALLCENIIVGEVPNFLVY